MTKKRQILPTGREFWLLGTPIGNLGDASPRLKEALDRAHVIYCEDTRVTRVLLSALGISAQGKQLLRGDAHQSPKQWAASLTEVFQSHKCAALVTDAGMPGVSDPGALAVQAARSLGAVVRIVPGPSAVACMQALSGMSAPVWSFIGFFEADLMRAELERGSRCVVCFESPKRVLESIQKIQEILGNSAQICVAKELTKVHERAWVGSVAEVFEALKAHFETEGARGEWVIVALASPRVEAAAADAEWERALELFDSESPLKSPRDIAKRVSQVFGVDSKRVYSRLIERALRKKSFVARGD